MRSRSSPATIEFRCVTCGYGICVSGEPPACPMCRESAWELAREAHAQSGWSRP